MSRRAHQRTSISLPVRVFGMDVNGKTFYEFATTVNVSPSGACLHGVTVNLRPHDVIGIYRGHRKGSFVVSWVGESGSPREGLIGITALTPTKQFWGVLASPCPDVFRPVSAETICQEDKVLPRSANCNLSGIIRQEGHSIEVKGSVMRINAYRLQFKSLSAFPAGTKVRLEITIEGKILRLSGKVYETDLGQGMKIRLSPMSDYYRSIIECWAAQQTVKRTPSASGHVSTLPTTFTKATWDDLQRYVLSPTQQAF